MKEEEKERGEERKKEEKKISSPPFFPSLRAAYRQAKNGGTDCGWVMFAINIDVLHTAKVVGVEGDTGAKNWEIFYRE